jgi:hypothetical protein
MNRLALFSLLLAACADTGAEGFEILHNLNPGTGGECTVTAGGNFLPHGAIEQASPVGYIFTPELSSRIVVTDGTTSAQRTISLRGANIEVTDANTGGSLAKFKSLFSGSLPPSATVATSFTILPPAVLTSLGVPAGGLEVLAKITPFGSLGGTGDDIDGVPFYYPVTICNGCVARVIGNCPAPAGTSEGSPNGCNVFQDGNVNCCMETEGELAGTITCPTTTAMTAR